LKTLSFSALLRDVRACNACAEHLPLGPRPVLQCHPAARVLLVGQAPGRKVHESGIPFDDASGKRLRQWLGITPEVFYAAQQIAIVPMGFCYPGTGTSGDLPPRPECAPLWREKLLAQLHNIELTLIIGQYVLAYHLPGGAGTLTEQVGDWRKHWPSKLVLPHPSPRNNIWLKRNPWFERDVVPQLQDRMAQLLAG
jgi:uracil-DNA glycosylase